MCALLQIAALGYQNEFFCDILDSAAFKLLPERVFEICWFSTMLSLQVALQFCA